MNTNPPTDPTSPPDQTLRDRIAEALAPYFANFSDWETARINAGEAAAAVLAVLPQPAPAPVAPMSEREAELRALYDDKWPAGSVHFLLGVIDQLRAAHGNRAAVLLEAIAALEQVRDTKDVNVASYPRYDQHQQRALNAGISALRRLAVEAPQPEPIVTVHAAPNLSTAAQEALGALVDVAKQQAACDFQHPHPEHPCGTHGAEAPRPDAAALAAAGPGRAADTRDDEETPEIVHGCPPDGSGVTPCCGRTPFELPLTDRMSTDSALVTCRGAEQ